MPNCAFSCQRNYEHKQKQERTDKILITEYVVVTVFFPPVSLLFFSLHSEIKPVALVPFVLQTFLSDKYLNQV